MTEESLFWTTDGTGDGIATGYTMEQVRGHFRSLGLTDMTSQAILEGLTVTAPSANTIRLALGRAIVAGFPYENDAQLDLNVGSPAADRGLTAVLRADWTAQTVRAVVLVSGVDATPPTVTQTMGSTWEVSLATAVIDSSGNIWTDATKTVSGVTTVEARAVINQMVDIGNMLDDSVDTGQLVDDAVTLAKIATNAVDTGQLVDDAVTLAKIATNAVDTGQLVDDAVDDTKVGDRVAQFYRRRGNSATNFDAPGTTTYTPTAIRVQFGSHAINSIDAASATSSAVTFPTAFSGNPIVIATAYQATANEGFAFVSNVSTTGFTAGCYNESGTQQDFRVYWMAIGPE